jgi:hypothetical protein
VHHLNLLAGPRSWTVPGYLCQVHDVDQWANGGGAELPPDSRFCNKCGAPIAPAATSAEYKQVTVLFADVVHSIDIAAAVVSGPEETQRHDQKDTISAGRTADISQRPGRVNPWVARLSRSG